MYHYHDVSEGDFEKIVVAICKELLGPGTTGFSLGPDGGRDAKFNGTANYFPSESSKWSGITIIQAKHTSGINKDFAQPDFYSDTSESCILSQEVEKVIKLIQSDGLSNYMLFSNRKMTGGVDLKIKSYITEKTGLDEFNLAILGINELNYYMSKYPYIVQLGNLCPLTIAPIINPNELSEVIDAFSGVFKQNIHSLDISSIDRTSFKEKNIINNMSDEMAQALEKSYLSYTKNIESFLNDPQNTHVLELYQEATEEFQQTFIVPQRKNIAIFDDIFNRLVELLINRNYLLRTHKKLTRIMVFYMYWNCDIGIAKNDQTNQT